MDGEKEETRLSFATALNNKYTDYEPKLFDSIQLSPKRRAAFLNQQSHKQRQILALDSCKVSNAGKPGEISAICPNLKELDLANNFLSSWEEIFCIISQLPMLQFLNLSYNPLDSDFDKQRIQDITKNNAMPPLQKLILNSTKTDLKDVFSLLTVFPSVEELHLSLNSYGKLIDWPGTFPNIKRLHFNRNDLEDWGEVMKIGQIFPGLNCLILCENPVEEVALSEDENVFTELSTLSLSKTGISNWKSIDEIRKFPALKDLRVVGVPLADAEEPTKRRQLFISRLPNVRKLNGSMIEYEEREDAERMFIRHHLDCENPPERYHELVQKHGKLDKLADIDFNVLGGMNCVSMEIDFEGNDTHANSGSVKIMVDLSVDVKTLKKEIGKKVGLPPKKFRFFYCSLQDVNPVEMRQPHYSVLRYNMNDGDRFLVQERF